MLGRKVEKAGEASASDQSTVLVVEDDVLV
jgi:hypothetical protein